MVILEILENKEKIWIMNNFKILILLNIFLIVSSCGTLKEGFKNQKKNNSDEFLVQKKSPLVMPPEYDKLPVPNQQEDEVKNSEAEPIKELILNKDDQNQKLNEKSDVSNNLKNKLLEKIKNN